MADHQNTPSPHSSLDPLETTHTHNVLSISEDIAPNDRLCQTWRHSGWKHNRIRVWLALQYANASDKRLDRFKQCGCHLWLYRHALEPDLYRLAGSKCRDRFCQPCANERARLVAANLARECAGRCVRFITLTLQHDSRPLAVSMDHLRDSFRRLRKNPYFRSRVRGGCAFTEVTYNPNTDQWHPHLHILAEGVYYDQQILSNNWEHASKGSSIVDIRAVKGRARIIEYVAKYAGKALSGTITRNHDRLVEAIEAFNSKRAFTCFGEWRHFALSEPPDAADWDRLYSFDDLVTKYENGDKQAARILAQLQFPIPYAPFRRPRPPPARTQPKQIGSRHPELFDTSPWRSREPTDYRKRP